MNLRDDDFELDFGSFGTSRDVPITFRFRSDADAMARLALSPAADGRYADARNAVFTEAKLATDMGRGLSSKQASGCFHQSATNGMNRNTIAD